MAFDEFRDIEILPDVEYARKVNSETVSHACIFGLFSGPSSSCRGHVLEYFAPFFLVIPNNSQLTYTYYT